MLSENIVFVVLAFLLFLSNSMGSTIIFARALILLPSLLWGDLNSRPLTLVRTCTLDHSAISSSSEKSTPPFKAQTIGPNPQEKGLKPPGPSPWIFNPCASMFLTLSRLQRHINIITLFTFFIRK